MNSETPNIGQWITIGITILAFLIGLMKYFIGLAISESNNRQDDLEEDFSNKFDRYDERFHSFQKEIINRLECIDNKISELNLEIAKNYVSKEFLKDVLSNLPCKNNDKKC